MHFAQRLRMDGDHFHDCYSLLQLFNQRLIIHVITFSVQFRSLIGWSRDSQDERVAFGDGYGMFEVRRQ